jgi:hypothetical protein
MGPEPNPDPVSRLQQTVLKRLITSQSPVKPTVNYFQRHATLFRRHVGGQSHISRTPKL